METIPRAVAVTGAAGYIGKHIVQRLLDEDAVQQVVAVDLQPAPLAHPKLTYLRQDINAPLETAFHTAGIDAVVHLAFVLRQLRNRNESRRVNLQGTANVLQASASTEVRRLVLMSSATVYGPHPHNPQFLPETATLRPPPAFHYAVDKAACEALCREYAEKHSNTDLTVLRGSVVMGPNARNFITTALNKPLLIGVRGADAPLQFVHEDDLMELLWEAVSRPRPGTYNVAGKGEVPWSEVASLSGKRLAWLPAPLAYGLTEATWRLRLQNNAPSAGLDFIRWPWTVSTEKLEKSFDYRLQHTSRDALLNYLEK